MFDGTEVVGVLFEDGWRLDAGRGIDFEDVRPTVLFRHHQIHCTKVQSESTNTSDCGDFTFLPLLVVGERDVVDCEVPAVRVIANQLLVRCLFGVTVPPFLLDGDHLSTRYVQPVLGILPNIPGI